MVDEFGSGEEFIVDWNEPGQAAQFWPRDEVHFPRALSPLGASIVPALEYDGVEAAAIELALPVRILAHVANGFVYNSIQPRGSSVSEQKELEARHRSVIQGHVVRLPERWAREYRPELEDANRTLLSLDLGRMPDGELHESLTRALELLKRHWQLHFLVVLPIFAAGGALVQEYEALFGSGDERAPYRLLQGIENRTLEADQGLWHLARIAARDQDVGEALRDGADLEALEKLPGGRSFCAAVERYLAEFGNRVAAADDVVDPTWAEDPRFVLRAVVGYLATGGESPEERRARLAAEREQEFSRMVAQTADDVARQEFLEALHRARSVWPLRETHTHYIDQPTFAILRRIALEFGRRLAGRGALERPDDVFLLTRGEMEDAHSSGSTVLQTVSARRSEYERSLQTIPPPFIGTLPPADAPPPDSELQKFFGRPPGAVTDERVIPGIAASTGRARGVARVVLSPDDFALVRPGDVLVCPSTTPPWTPLFGLVAALVTDAGGVLSHGAIVAREYGLPAVTGTRSATRRIQSGQLVEVDGDVGEVRLLGE